MRRLASLLLILAFSLPACFSSDSTEPKYRIALSLAPGSEFRLKTLSSQTIQSQMQQGVVQHRQHIEMFGILRAERVQGEAIDITVRYTRVRCLLQGHQQQILFDSDKDKNVPAPALEYAQLVGASFSATLTPNGKVTRISGAGALDTKNETTLKQMLQHTFAFLPEKTVTVGESWSKTSDLTASAGIRVDAKWTLSSVQEGYYAIASQGTITSSRPPGSEGTYLDVKGTQKGDLVVRTTTGIPELVGVQRIMEGVSVNTQTQTRTPVAVRTEIKLELLPIKRQNGKPPHAEESS